MQRYFLQQTYSEAVAQGLYLVGQDQHHALNVMRMKEGHQCFLVFQEQVAIKAEIIAIEAQGIKLRELERELAIKELPVAVTIACGYPKGDKLELVVQKGTELGAYEFIGFPSQTSVVKWDQKKLGKRQERLEKIAKEASEQSHRQVQPTVKLFEQGGDFFSTLGNYDTVLIAYEESAKLNETTQLVKTLQSHHAGDKLLVIFGPEGGLTAQEVAFFEGQGGVVCGLGPRIMRAETAPLYLLSAISYQLELLK